MYHEIYMSRTWTLEGFNGMWWLHRHDNHAATRISHAEAMARRNFVLMGI